MKEESGKYVPIKLVVGKMIPLFANENFAALLCQKLLASIIEYFSQLGIKGSPTIALQQATDKENGRVMQIFADGILQPYSEATMRMTWQSRFPSDLGFLPDQKKFFYHFPDKWLNDYLLGLDLSDNHSINNILDFLAGLAFEALLEKPSVLISKQQVLDYIESVKETTQVNVDFITGVLKFLLDHRISIKERHTILEIIRQSYELGKSSEDTSELLFARLRSPYIELNVSVEEFSSLAGSKKEIGIIPAYSSEVNKDSQDLMKRMEEQLYWDLGVNLPDIVWNVNPNIPPGFIAFKMNDQTSQLIRLLSKDELLVNCSPDRLIHLNVVNNATVNPVNDQNCSIVPVSNKALIENEGITTWGPLNYIILLTEHEIQHHASKLFTINDAMYHLSQIRQYFPDLVKKILKRFSIEKLTRILRALLDEGISIHDLWSILECLLKYDTIQVDSKNYIVFDERLPVSPSSQVLHPESWESCYAFLRSGLKRQITSKLLQGRNTIPMYQLHAEIEQWLTTENVSVQENSKDLEVKRQNVRQAIWDAITPSNGYKPVILTTTEPRVSLQKILSREMPNVYIAAYSELTPDASLKRISIIDLP